MSALRRLLFPAALVVVGCGPTSSGGDADEGRDASWDPGTRGDAGVADADGGAADGGSCEPVATCPVIFRVAAGEASSISLRGDFAPDGWSQGVDMTRAGNVFEATLTLAHDQTVVYKLLVDGREWRPDPDNPDRVPDGFGGWNSVRSVSCHACAHGPGEWRDGVMYFVLVDRFLDGDPSNNRRTPGVEPPADFHGGDLAGVKQKIEEGYFTDLGANVLWLTAPFDNADSAGEGEDGYAYSAYHGYWPAELDAVDARVGDLATLRAVVEAAHARGLRVVLDYVMNHVHRESPIYAAHPDWFWPLDGCVCGQGCSWDAESDRKRCWFRPYLPDFDFRHPEARAFSVGNAIHWIAATGIDGYRLDAVKHIETEWIVDLRARLRAEVEQGGRRFYLVGETFSSDRGLLKSYVDPQTMLDGQFDFPLRAEIVRTILMRRGRMADLAAFLDGNDGYYGPDAIMGTFLGNHDLPRAVHLAEDAPQFGEWDSGKTRAWSNRPTQPTSAAPYERLAVAYALLVTLPGMPLIYYGDEIGLAGGGDPDNRRPMPWDALSPAQEALRARVAALARLRTAHPALWRGRRIALGAGQDTLVYAKVGGGEVLYVALNRGDAPAAAEGLPPGSYRDLLSGAAFATPITLPARSALVLEARR